MAAFPWNTTGVSTRPATPRYSGASAAAAAAGIEPISPALMGALGGEVRAQGGRGAMRVAIPPRVFVGGRLDTVALQPVSSIGPNANGTATIPAGGQLTATFGGPNTNLNRPAVLNNIELQSDTAPTAAAGLYILAEGYTNGTPTQYPLAGTASVIFASPVKRYFANPWMRLTDPRDNLGIAVNTQTGYFVTFLNATAAAIIVGISGRE